MQAVSVISLEFVSVGCPTSETRGSNEKSCLLRVVHAARRSAVRLYVPCTVRVSSLTSGSSHVHDETSV